MYNSALLNTSGKEDVLSSGGVLNITGLREMRIEDILDFTIRNYQAEVQAVKTIGDTTDPTITADTKYTIMFDVVRSDGSFSTIHVTHVSPGALSGSASTDRQNVYDALASKINDNDTIKWTADAGSSGTKMTLTEDSGYYKVDTRRQGPLGVYLIPDDNGGGFDEDTHLETATEPVVAFGEGQRLIDAEPVADPITGNLSQGDSWDSPKGAIADQHYAGFMVETMKRASDTSVISGFRPHVTDRQLVYVDDGTGNDTSNASGFAKFLREIERFIYQSMFGNDPKAIIALMDSKPIHTADSGGAATGSTGDENIVDFDNARLTQHILGTQTTTRINYDDDGLDLVQDSDDNDGMELSASIEALSRKYFLARREEFSLRVELKVADITDINPLVVGFRKREAFQADFNDYDELVGLGIDDAAGATKSVKAFQILNNAATQSIDTGEDVGDETFTLEIQVDGDGICHYFVNDVNVTDTVDATNQMQFDEDEELIPFVYHVNEGANDPGTYLRKFFSVPGAIRRVA